VFDSTWVLPTDISTYTDDTVGLTSFFTWEDRLAKQCSSHNFCGTPTFAFRTNEDPHKDININGKTITEGVADITNWSGNPRSRKIELKILTREESDVGIHEIKVVGTLV
jgi:hypothetical protein